MTNHIKFPVPTGHGAQVLGTTEPALADMVRRGKVNPEPPILAGRRLWYREHLLQAAEALGVLTDELRVVLEDATTGSSNEVRK